MLTHDSLLPRKDRDSLLGSFAGGMLNQVPQAYSGDPKRYGFGPGFNWFGAPATDPPPPGGTGGVDQAELLSMLYPALFATDGSLTDRARTVPGYAKGLQMAVDKGDWAWLAKLHGMYGDYWGQHDAAHGGPFAGRQPRQRGQGGGR